MTAATAEAWVRQYLGELLGQAPDAIELERTLSAYGLDSVDAVTMIGELEDAFGIQVDAGTFLQHPTIGAAVAAIERLLVARS